MAKLTPKQEMFVEEYLLDLNATQAAIRAGYSPKTAAEQGNRLLTNVKVRTCLDQEMAERSKRTGINQDRVIREIARLAFINPDNVMNLNSATVRKDALEEDLAAIQSVKVKMSSSENGEMVEREVRLNDKLKALELLGKHLGMFKDKVEVSVLTEEKNKLDSLLNQIRGT
ncbi:terminase small subunit [Candidatus Clostridium stratigraminis]|uniref:Terminase small subunit n=1 Tax=Candidatus Clostridium stratigraminis TaxID=3381661 RepID=A0ABW8SYG4_9CLOT